ncbi:hypothetical protein [Flavobacterium sp.]|uniref:hypothetical protein n=1 Tax=Flavobacterium sp. TaxID=239 RepID=UPI0025E3A9A2|nr:hypothetical protein [Flavobacterium sp.]
MKNHKFQQIRVTVTKPGDSLRFNAQTDKQYARIRGIYVSIPEERLVPGCLLGLKVNNQDIFEDVHEVKLLTSGNQVAPNKKFFFFEEHLDAAGSTVEGRFTDGQTQVDLASLAANSETGFSTYGYPYEVKIYLWLTNEK